MQPGNTIRRTSLWGDVVIRDNITEQEVKNYKDLQKQGFEFEVLVDNKWEKVPKIVIHQREVPESCESCSS